MIAAKKIKYSLYFSKFCSITVALIGLTVLIGWIFHIDSLLNIVPSWPTMKVNTSVCFLLLGISITSIHPGNLNFIGSRISQALSIIVGLIALITIAEHIFKIDLFIDQLFIEDYKSETHSISPGRMSLITSSSFLFISLCLYFKAYDIYKKGEDQYLLLLPIFKSIFIILFYLYNKEGYVYNDITSTALHTALMFIIASLGIIFIQPERGWLAIALSDTASGTIFRNLLIPNLFLFPIIGVLRLLAQTKLYIASALGLSIMVIAELVIVTLAIIFQGRKLFNLEIENRKIHHELVERYKELSLVNTDLDTFVYTASHDLKAPLHNIDSLIRMFYDEIPEETKKKADLDEIKKMIDQSIQKFKNTIDDLSVTAKIGIDGSSIQTPVKFHDLLEEIKIGLKEQIDLSHASIQEDFSKAESIQFSRKNLRSILYNLLSNAIKYRDKNRLPLIYISTDKKDDYILLKVRDNGIGINEDDKEKVFGMYHRIHTHVEGSGIGMGIVARIVDTSGGKIEIESMVGQGSVFTIYLKNYPNVKKTGTV